MKDRTFERGTGCWNCIHSNNPVHAKVFWAERSQRELKAALDLALSSHMGEQHPKVVNMRRMIDIADHGVAAGVMIHCTKGRLPNGDQVGDLTAHNYMCSNWSGAEGSSLARINGKVDLLPEELREKIDGIGPTTVSKYLDKHGNGGKLV